MANQEAFLALMGNMQLLEYIANAMESVEISKENLVNCC